MLYLLELATEISKEVIDKSFLLFPEDDLLDVFLMLEEPFFLPQLQSSQPQSQFFFSGFFTKGSFPLPEFVKDASHSLLYWDKDMPVYFLNWPER